MSKQPVQHLAIIPDGNRRWAKKHAIGNPGKIYEKGTDKTFEIIDAAVKLNIPNLTIWASSYSNLRNRPTGSVNALEDMYEKKFRELATHPLIHDNQARIEVIGEWRELLKPQTIAAAEEAINATAHYSQRQLSILVGYDGRRERGAATLSLIAESHLNLQSVPDNINEAEQLLRSYAWTGHLPDADLIIRTGAWEDPHNSAGFLSFLSGESQLAFPPVLWPDFTAEMLTEIVEDFGNRERRLGK